MTPTPSSTSTRSERSTRPPLPDARPRRRFGLGALATGCAFGLVGVYVVFVRTQFGQEIDQAALEGRDLADLQARNAARRALGVITGTTLVLAIGALAAIAVARGRIRLALVPIVAIAGAVATSEVLKGWVLARPDLLDQPEYSNSFPSGHATIGLAVAWAAVVVAPPQARRTVAVVGTLIAAAIGIAAVAAAWHRPSDVVGGYLVATAWAAATMAVWAALYPARVDLRAIAGERAARTAVRFEWAAAALGLAGVATAVGFAISRHSDEIAWVDPGPDFVGGAIVVAAVAVGLVGLLALASGRITPRGRLRHLVQLRSD